LASAHAASALNVEAGRTQVHEVVAVKLDRNRSGMPLPRFEELMAAR
jgi:hypothetical protein